MYTICFDTICTGFAPVMEDDQPCTYATEAEAQAEIDSDPEFYEDCFPCLLSNIGHKTIYTGKEQHEETLQRSDTRAGREIQRNPQGLGFALSRNTRLCDGAGAG